MRVFLALLLCASVMYSQTVVVPIPGQRQTQPPEQQPGGGGGGGIGLVVGALIGAGLVFLITKAVLSKPSSETKKLPFIPFQFVAVYRGELPPQVKPAETVELEDLKFSMIEWKEEEDELRKALEDRVMILQPNYVYETFGEGNIKPSPGGTSDGLIAVLDTGADTELLKGILIEVKNMRSDPYRPEPHGTAVAYLSHLPQKAKILLYRVCSERRCDTWSVTKALVDVLRRDVKIVNMSFGTSADDRVVELLLRIAISKGVRITAPVGNEPSEKLPFPARLPEVISVAGSPCFPERICLKADAREPYEFETPFGRVKGTSFSSAYHAGRLSVLELR